MTASVSLRVDYGTNAGTESPSVTALELCAADALTGGSVNPGSNSFERWIRLRLDTAPVTGVTNFWLQNAGALPTGVTLRFGVTDTPRTPVATASTIATTELVAGRRYIWDANTYTQAGDHTRYLVIQAQTTASAASGAIDQQIPTIGWSEN